MTFNSLILLIEIFLMLLVFISMGNFLLKNRKRSADSIYKLIDDLEKKLQSVR